jgi:hypothetical protein
VGEIVGLGGVRCPSGQLVVVDGGALGMWSGEACPADLDPRGWGVTDAATLAEIWDAVDFEIVGPDAALADPSGRHRYDVPASRVADFVTDFEQRCRDHAWDAELVPFGRQVPHRERVRRCAAEREPGFAVFGMSAVAVDVPSDRWLQVEAQRSDGQWLGWFQMIVRVSDAPVVSTVEAGWVHVDAARLAFADADALTLWEHERPTDGLADVAFWGAVAEEAASEFGAAPLATPGDEGCFGWTDLPIASALMRARTIQGWKDADPKRRMALDFRPHSHHWQVMRQVRGSEIETGTIDLGDARILFAMTSWGDGVFPAYTDYDQDGNLVAVRVQLAES